MKIANIKCAFKIILAQITCVFCINASEASSVRVNIDDTLARKEALIGVTGPYSVQAELALSDAGGYLGQSVAAWLDPTSGVEWAVIGAPGENGRGAAYIYSKATASASWQEETRLTADDGADSDEFGSSVAISADVVAVGAPEHGDDSKKGAAYIFKRNSSNAWVKQTTLSAAGRGFFGYSLALQGNTLAVGAPYLGRNGYIFIYGQSGGVWTITSTPSPSDTSVGAEFGYSIALDGTHMIVGAPTDSSARESKIGSAYVFAFATGTWNVEQKLVAGLDRAPFDYFGSSVALLNDDIAVAAPGHDGGGAVYTFNRDSGLWILGPTIEARDGHSFGSSVALTSAGLAIGAVPHWATAGAVFIYSKVSSAWTLQTSFDGLENGLFGESIAALENGFLIGDPDYSSAQGGYIEPISFSGGAWKAEAAIRATSVNNENLGQDVSIDGTTAISSAPHQTVFAGPKGGANIFVRDPISGAWQLQTTLPDPEPGYESIGFHSCSPVVVNGDTALIGVPDENSGRGAVHVYGRSGTTWTALTTLMADSPADGDLFGCSIGVSGNTTVIGAPGLNHYAGGAYVFTRSADTWTQQTILQSDHPAANDYLGNSAAIDGDKIVLGAPFRSGSAGAAFVFARSAGTWALQAKLAASDSAGNDEFGASVSVFGSYLAIGAPNKTVAMSAGAGSVYIFSVTSGMWTQQQILGSNTTDAYFGSAVAMNSDSLIAGEPGTSSTAVFKRSGDKWSAYSVITGDAGGGLGSAASLSGSFAMVGAPGSGDNQGGRAYILVDGDGDTIFKDGFE